MITENQLEQITAHAESAWPECCCGIILSDDSILRCENVARDKIQTARLGIFERARIERCSPVVGFYCSRGGPLLPLVSDYDFADEFGMLYVVATVHDRGINELVTQAATYRLMGTPEGKSFEQILFRKSPSTVFATFFQRT